MTSSTQGANQTAAVVEAIAPALQAHQFMDVQESQALVNEPVHYRQIQGMLSHHTLINLN
jgi:hypothetical protein